MIGHLALEVGEEQADATLRTLESLVILSILINQMAGTVLGIIPLRRAREIPSPAAPK